MKKSFPSSLKYLLASLMLFGLTACAIGGIMDEDSYPVHHFSFDTMQDSPDIEVLDYQYSNSRHQGIKPERERVQIQASRGGFGGENIAGSILRGDFLYVKWRIKNRNTPPFDPNENKIYEDRVDLKSRLPKDITGLRIHFVIRGSQLYVYLVWPYDPKHDYPQGDLKGYERQKKVQIYPDITK